jgi:hypothetical protein
LWKTKLICGISSLSCIEPYTKKSIYLKKAFDLSTRKV